MAAVKFPPVTDGLLAVAAQRCDEAMLPFVLATDHMAAAIECAECRAVFMRGPPDNPDLLSFISGGDLRATVWLFSVVACALGDDVHVCGRWKEGIIRSKPEIKVVP